MSRGEEGAPESAQRDTRLAALPSIRPRRCCDAPAFVSFSLLSPKCFFVPSPPLCPQRYSVSQLTPQQQSVVEDLSVLGLVLLQKVCVCHSTTSTVLIQDYHHAVSRYCISKLYAVSVQSMRVQSQSSISSQNARLMVRRTVQAQAQY